MRDKKWGHAENLSVGIDPGSRDKWAAQSDSPTDMPGFRPGARLGFLGLAWGKFKDP